MPKCQNPAPKVLFVQDLAQNGRFHSFLWQQFNSQLELAQIPKPDPKRSWPGFGPK
jgi:hypothetical protein